jgi:Tfp pilus assembly protein PilW
MRNQKGLSLIELLLFAALIGLLLIFGVLVINSERAETRDSVRIADMSRIQYAFEVMFFEKNSYKDAGQGCPSVNSLVSQCTLSKYLPNIAAIADPGKSKYTVSKVPDDENFEVTFYLEKGYDSLRAGKHTLSSQGIR